MLVSEKDINCNSNRKVREKDYSVEIAKVSLSSIKKDTYRVTKKACYYQGGLPLNDDRYTLFEILR